MHKKVEEFGCLVPNCDTIRWQISKDIVKEKPNPTVVPDVELYTRLDYVIKPGQTVSFQIRNNSGGAKNNTPFPKIP